MDQIKCLVKDMLHIKQDSSDVLLYPIRMSQISSKSSLSSYRSRSVSEQSNSSNIGNFDTQNNNVPSVRPPGKVSKSSLSSYTSRSLSVQSVSNSSAGNVDTKNNNEANKTMPVSNETSYTESAQINTKTTHENDKSKKVPGIVNDLQKLQLKEKGSHDSVFSLPNRSPLLPKAGKTSKPKVLMGKRALRAKSFDFQENPSTLVHELVNEKYHDKIEHYIGRMYKRRLSRESRNTDDDGTSSNYSAGSLSTIGTPDSLYDGKSYFSLFFPPRSESEFDFLRSTDDLNKDTTADTILNSTNDSVDDAKDVSTDLEYDPQKFLKNALGDVSLESQYMDVSFRKSRLQSTQSIDTAHVSSLLSKAGSLYSSVRKSIRRACSFRDRNGEQNSSKNKARGKDRCQSFSPDCFGPAENLMQELYVQNGIIFQVSKALTYCRNTKDLSSPEYLEAEKILLIASCHKEALQNALDATEFGEKDKCCQLYSGTLNISNIVYYLKGDNCVEQGAQNDMTEYFVVVVRSGKNVYGSKVLVADKIGEIKVDKVFDLVGLTTDFEVSVAIYCMKIRNTEKNYGHSLKSNKNRKAPCPPSKSIFHLNHRSSSHRNLQVENVLSIKPSSFSLWGTCTIRCSDMERTHFRMHHVPLCSSLEGYFTAVLSSDVKLSNRATGFLTVGIEDKTHLVWSRRWCVLEGSLLKYWNYPSEEFSSDPIGSINLKYAVEKVSPADRSMCPRPRTLCLLVKNNGIILKYFLSTDSPEEKQSWLEEFNFVIGTLGAWNLINSKNKS